MSGNAPGKMRAPREPKPVKDPAQQAVRMAEHARKRQEYDESKAQHREAMAHVFCSSGTLTTMVGVCPLHRPSSRQGAGTLQLPQSSRTSALTDDSSW